jgi:hypothetical protein
MDMNFWIEDESLKTENKIKNIKIIKAEKLLLSYKHREYKLMIEFEYDNELKKIQDDYRYCVKCEMFELAEIFFESLDEKDNYDCCTFTRGSKEIRP